MNTKTTITIDWLKVAEAIGWLVTTLSVVPYSSGEIASLFPPKWRPYVTGIFGAATVLTKVWRAIPALPFNRPPPVVEPAAPCPVCTKRKRKKAPK